MLVLLTSLLLLSSVLSQTCNQPLLSTHSPVQAFVNRIVTNSLTAVVGPAPLPLLDGDSYFLGASPSNLTTILELNAPTSGLLGSFWLTGIGLIQRPTDSQAAAYGCMGSEDENDLHLFQVHYGRNGLHYPLEYDNAPLGIYRFQGVTSAEEAEVKVAVRPTIVDSVRISKYYSGVGLFCLQFELYGCAATDQLTHPDVLQYDIPQPNAKSGPINRHTFSDQLYNGLCSNGICTGGVGVLTDGYIESSTYTAYSRFAGWDGSSTYNIKLYLYSVNAIQKIIFYGNQWLALPVDSRAPDYISVNGQRFRVKTTPGQGEAGFSYFGIGVYYVSVPIVTTASLLDITFECSSYYSLLLSEIELIARSASGVDVQLSQQIYLSNGSSLDLDSISVFTPDPISNQSGSNITFPTLYTTLSLPDTSTPGAVNSTLPDLTIIIPFSVATFALLIIICSLIIFSLLLWCKICHLKQKSKFSLISSPLPTSVVHNRHYIPNSPQGCAVNSQLQQAAYESIESFDYTSRVSKQELELNLPDSARYSVLKRTYNETKSPVEEPLSSPHLRPENPPNSGYDDYPVPNPMYNLTRRDMN